MSSSRKGSERAAKQAATQKIVAHDNHQYDSRELSSKKKQDLPSQHRYHRVAGCFATGILRKQNDLGIPGSWIPLRTPGSARKDIDHEKSSTGSQCRCRKSNCILLYCDCFRDGVYCGSSCRCLESACQNNEKSAENVERRNQAILDCIKEDPRAFRKGGKNSAVMATDQPLTCSKNQYLKKSCNGNGEESQCKGACPSENCKNKRKDPTPAELDTNVKRAKTMEDPFGFMPKLEAKTGRKQIPGIEFFRGQGATSTDNTDETTMVSAAADTDESHDDLKSCVAGRVIDEIHRQLTSSETSGDNHNGARSSSKNERGTGDYAHRIISNVRSHLLHMLRAAKAAEVHVREDTTAKIAVELERSAQREARKHTTHNLGLGTKFTKRFDVLGEFEGKIVVLPTPASPFYQVEYEDGGTEALLHHDLLRLFKERNRHAATLQPLQRPFPPSLPAHLANQVEDQAQVAREEALQHAFFLL